MGNCLSMILWHDTYQLFKNNINNIRNKKNKSANFNYNDVSVQTENNNELNKPLLKDTSSINNCVDTNNTNNTNIDNNIDNSVYISVYSKNSLNSSNELYSSALSNLDNL